MPSGTPPLALLRVKGAGDRVIRIVRHSLEALHEAPGVSLWVGHGDLSHAVTTSTGRIQVDTSSRDPLMDGIDVVNQHADPGAEPAGLVAPVGHRAVKPHLAVAYRQFDVADHSVIVGPTVALDKSENLNTPVGNGASISTDVRNRTSNFGLAAHLAILARSANSRDRGHDARML